MVRNARTQLTSRILGLITFVGGLAIAAVSLLRRCHRGERWR